MILGDWSSDVCSSDLDYCNQLMRDAGVENADYAHMSDEMAENAREQDRKSVV